MNAKCKKFLTMLLLVCVSIGAAGCSAYSNQRYYERAQLMMGSGEYAEAAELFDRRRAGGESQQGVRRRGVAVDRHRIEGVRDALR